MTDYEIYSLQSYIDGIEEDLRPIKRAEFEDLNQEKITTYLTNIKKDKPNLSKFSDEKILKLNGIIENSTGKIRPTLAGMMVFGEYPQGYLPQLFIACVVVPGRKLGDVGELGQRFRDEMQKMNLPEPEFETLRGTFKVTFRKEKQEIISQNTENCTDNFTENCVENCTDNELKLLELLKVSPNMTQLELSNKLNVSRRTISTLLGNLKEKNKIERVGSDRKGYWKIL